MQLLSCFGKRENQKVITVYSPQPLKNMRSLQYNFDKNQSLLYTPNTLTKKPQTAKVIASPELQQQQALFQARILHKEAQKKVRRLQDRCEDLKQKNEKFNAWSKSLQKDVMFLQRQLENRGIGSNSMTQNDIIIAGNLNSAYTLSNVSQPQQAFLRRLRRMSTQGSDSSGYMSGF